MMQIRLILYDGRYSELESKVSKTSPLVPYVPHHQSPMTRRPSAGIPVMAPPSSSSSAAGTTGSSTSASGEASGGNDHFYFEFYLEF